MKLDAIKKWHEGLQSKVHNECTIRKDQLLEGLKSSFPGIEYVEGNGSYFICDGEGVGGALYEVGELAGGQITYEQFLDKASRYFILEDYEVTETQFILIQELMNIMDFELNEM